MTNPKLPVWLLKKGSEKKFRLGHPWVFSNELAQSPKGLPAGALVELRDHQGGFLAYGYGHPNSLISFRTLSLNEDQVIDVEFILTRFRHATRLRRVAGVDRFSHRFCFAEGDGLPGLVVDRFMLADRSGQVFVLQSSTAGMDGLFSMVIEALERFVNEEALQDPQRFTWRDTAVIVANDSKSRLMEGVPIQEKRVQKPRSGFEAARSQILIQDASRPDEAIPFSVDFLNGQKTGFFLDQRSNVQQALRLVQGLMAEGRRELRVLDLCCYVGQWGGQIANLVAKVGGRAHVTCVDASAKALELAVENVKLNGGSAIAAKMDVMNELNSIENRSFDVVICDPPAFIKKKKDLPTGTQAYFKMNREALRKVRDEGIFITCSCSGLFGEEEFREMLARVVGSAGAGRSSDAVRWLMRGGHSPDHPQRPEFPQGTYLKSWLGVVS